MTLATSNPELIQDMLEVMNKNRDSIETDINYLVYHMNGGLPYDDAFLLTQDQRQSLAHMLKKLLDPKNNDL